MVSTGDKYAERCRAKARNSGIRTDRMQATYVKERILYRLDEALPGLMVKGSTVDYMRSPATARFSPDLDLHLPERPDDFDLILEDILRSAFYDENGVLDDGFSLGAIRCQELRALDEPGIKFRLECHLGNTRVPMKIDFAFGGTRPDPLEIQVYPSMFHGFPEIRVRTQPIAHKLADKLHAIVEHGADNTRVKDYWDIAYHLDRGTVSADELARAVAVTFRDRGTEIHANPVGLTAAFAIANETAWTKWHADMGVPQDRKLVEVVEAIRPFVTRALVRALRLQEPTQAYLRLVPAA